MSVGRIDAERLAIFFYKLVLNIFGHIFDKILIFL